MELELELELVGDELTWTTGGGAGSDLEVELELERGFSGGELNSKQSAYDDLLFGMDLDLDLQLGSRAGFGPGGISADLKVH